MAYLSKTRAFILAMAVVGLLWSTVASAQEYSGLMLTQTKATLGVGQSVNLISVNGKNLKATRSSSVVGVNVYGGNQITLYGRRVGTATVKLCDVTLGCETISVKVQKSRDAKLTLAKTKVSVRANETVSVLAKNGNDVTAYSNSSKLVAYTDGPNIAMRGVAPGKATVTVCSSNRGCLPIYVNVAPAQKKQVLGVKVKAGDNEYKSKGALPVSQTSLVLENGTSRDIYAESHALKVSGENGIVRTAVNDNRVTVYGVAVGTATLNVCDPSSLCASVHVKVTNGLADFEVSNTKITVAYGQTLVVKAIGQGPFTAGSDNNWVAGVSVSGNSISVTGGYWSGDTTVRICNSLNECKSVAVSVRQSVSSGNSQARATGSFSSVVLKVGESKKVYGRNLDSSYSISNNSNSYVVNARLITGDVMLLEAVAEGTSIITLCPSSKYYSCGTVGVTVVKDDGDDSIVYDDNAPIKLSQTSVALKRNETFDLKASTGNGLTAVSDTQAVRTAINANRITLYATNPGDANVTICAGNGSCATVKVKVSL